MVRPRARDLSTLIAAHRRDVAVGTVIGLAAVGFHLWSTGILPSSDNLPLFGADTARTVRHMTVRAPMLDRSQFHLLFPVLAQTPTRLAVAAGLGTLNAVHAAIAAWGGIAAAAFYAVARKAGMRPIQAAGPAALGAVAGASIVFYAIPETYGVGAAVVTLAILLVATLQRRSPSLQGSVALVLGASVTLPAVIIPLVGVTAARPGWRKWASQLTGAGLAMALLLILQRVVFGTEINATVAGESQFLHSDVGNRFLLSLRTALLDAWATPRPHLLGGVVTFRHVPWWSGGWLRLVAALLLAALWIAAARSVWQRRCNLVVMSCAAAVIAQVLLSSFYGDEPFLYAAPLVPMILAIVVVSADDSNRRWISSICWLLVPVLVVLNLQHLHAATRLISHTH